MDCQGYYRSFGVLSKRREYNEAGPQPLRVSEIAAYLTELGLSGGEKREKFLHLLLDLDDEQIDHHFKQKEQAPKS